MTEVIKNFPPFRVNPISKQIENKIIEMEKDEFLAYAGIKELTGYDCDSQGEGYTYLNRAMKRAARKGHHSKIIPGKGMLKLTASGALDYYQNQQEIKNRQINRQNLEMSTIEESELTPLEQIEYKAVSFIGELASRVMSKKGKKKLIEHINKSPNKQIDYEDVVGSYLRTKS